MEKPSLPSGTRDFGPSVMAKRSYLMDTITQTFKLYGFNQIETPAVENLKTLQGKYGDEGDQLLFKILNNGDFLAKADAQLLQDKNSKSITPQISDRGLRYDLTVPMARFVVMNRNDISFPFKRFQLQPVWRADRPQKGRYREFWQCDADVVGSKSILNEIELIKIYLEVFKKLNLPVKIKINNRKIFDALENTLGGKEGLNRFMQLIDKYDKIGYEGVLEELRKEEIKKGAEVWSLLGENNQKNTTDKLALIQNSDLFEKEKLNAAQTEIDFVITYFQNNEYVVWDFTLARGLSYYTGWVFEVVPDKSKINSDFSIGSIGGGGRYDNLTEIFGLKDVSGVGISFGIDRIYDTLENLNLFPQNLAVNAKVIVCPIEDSELFNALEIAGNLRANNIETILYPEAAKLKKQLDFANNTQVEFAVLIGSRESENKIAAVKHLPTGVQKEIAFTQLSHEILNWK